jgi:hypothetical protein
MAGDKTPDITAEVGGERRTTRQMYHAERSGDLAVPFVNIDTLESITLGFRADMFTLGDPDTRGGSVATGSGMGTDFIMLEWNDGRQKHKAMLRGLDVLRAWVATVDPEAVKGFPEGLK